MIEIDVFQDTVCPWCRIGKENLRQALAAWPEPAQVRYHAFFLNEDVPPEGVDFVTYMEEKFNGRLSLAQLFDGPTQRGAEVGLTFNFANVTKYPNTTHSHQLIQLAPDMYKEAVVDAVYKAYFADGRDIGDLDVLVAIAAEVGWQQPTLRQQLADGEGAAEVLADVQWAREQGITGVPFFIINGRYAFSGAQPPAAIQRVFQQATAVA